MNAFGLHWFAGKTVNTGTNTSHSFLEGGKKKQEVTGTAERSNSKNV